MASVHEIGIASDTRAFDDGIRSGVIKPVESAVKAFDKLEDAVDGIDAGSSLGKLEKGLDKVSDAAEDAGKDGARGLDKLEEKIRDVQKESDKAERAVDDIGERANDAGTTGAAGMDRIKGGAQELQSEIGSNLGEAVSSFRGDISDLGQVGQDTLGGLAATVASAGPAGLLGAFALAAGAAGLGLFTAKQQEAKEKQDEINEAAANFASGYVDGINGAISAAQIFAEINAIATDPERYQQAKDAAVEWGVDTRTAMGAMAGDATALALSQEGLARRTEESARRSAELETQTDSTAGAVIDMADSVKSGADRMDGLTQAMALGKQQADDAAGALYNYATSAGEATDQTDDLGNQIVRLPDGKEIVIDAETRRAYEDIDAIEKRTIAGKTVDIIVRGNTSDFDRKMAEISARAQRGVTIAMRTNTGAAVY